MPDAQTTAHPDSYSDFEGWFVNTFIRRNEGWKPRNLKLWHSKVESSHQEIRGFLGGVRRERRYKLASQQGKLPIGMREYYTKEINAVVPNYFTNSGYTPEILDLPTMTIGTHRAVRVAKTIRGQAEQILAGYGLTDNDYRTKLKQLDKILSDLGSEWARARTSETEIEVNFSTSPRAFSLLGHLGPDSDSCWRQTSDKTWQKYTLGQSKNTFVVIISKPDAKNKWKTVARCFGFAQKPFNIINLCNYYFAPGFAEGDGLAAIRMFIEDLWQDSCEFHEDKIAIHGKPLSVYQNPYGNWSFSKGKGSRIDDIQILRPDENNIRIFECPKCARIYKTDEDWYEVDEQFVCVRCVNAASRCELTGRYTFKPLVEYNDREGNVLMIHPDEAAKKQTCCKCNNVFDAVEKVDDTNVCKSCLEIFYTECDGCGKMASDMDVNDDGDLCLCPECMEKGVSQLEDYTISLLSNT